jgi:DNA polymerase-3 subunit alpha
VNTGFKEFTVDRGRIRFGLVAVKNVGESAIDAILEARAAGGRFSSLFDFCERVDLKRVNKRVVESLIKCGAYDSTGARRSQLMAALDAAFDHGQRVQREKCDPQLALFGGGECPAPVPPPALPELAEWDDRQRLGFEKESLGFYLSGHPLTRYEELISKFATTDALAIKEAADGLQVRIGGLVRGTKTIKTRKGDLMGFATIEDRHGAVEVTVFSRLFAAASDLLAEDTAVLVQGQVQRDEQSVKLVADTLIPLEKAEESWTASVHLSLDLDAISREQLLQLREVLQRYPGSCKTYLHLHSPERTEAVVEAAAGVHLKAGAALRREVSEVLGVNSLETRCSPIKGVEPPRGRNQGWGRN